MSTPERYSINEGKREIAFELRFSKRKSVGICVTPEADIQVTAPEGTELARVLQVLKKRMPWIIERLTEFEGARIIDRPQNYESGQSLKYLGRDYMLRVSQIEEFEEERVFLDHSVLKVEVRDRDCSDRINLMVEEWYRRETLVFLAEKFELLYQRVKKYDISKPQFYLRRMSKRWGSCTSKGVIFLNPELIKLPSHCIEYAIIHELCHLKFPNHSKEYYFFLDTVMPDWKICEKDLEIYECA